MSCRAVSCHEWGVEGHVTSYRVEHTSGVLCCGVECHAILYRVMSCHEWSGV